MHRCLRFAAFRRESWRKSRRAFSEFLWDRRLPFIPPSCKYHFFGAPGNPFRLHGNARLSGFSRRADDRKGAPMERTHPVPSQASLFFRISVVHADQLRRPLHRECQRQISLRTEVSLRVLQPYLNLGHIQPVCLRLAPITGRPDHGRLSSRSYRVACSFFSILIAHQLDAARFIGHIPA